MTKQTFIKHIIVSSIVTATAIASIIVFSIVMFHRYSAPNESNTFMSNGTVTEVYHSKSGIRIAMANERTLGLVYPTTSQKLYSAIGYDTSELAELLEGKTIRYRRMDHVAWIVEIYVDDIKIDNNRLTAQQSVATRVGITVLALIMLTFIIVGDVSFLSTKYRQYRKAEKKRERKARRALQRAQNKTK